MFSVSDVSAQGCTLVSLVIAGCITTLTDFSVGKRTWRGCSEQATTCMEHDAPYWRTAC